MAQFSPDWATISASHKQLHEDQAMFMLGSNLTPSQSFQFCPEDQALEVKLIEKETESSKGLAREIPMNDNPHNPQQQLSIDQAKLFKSSSLSFLGQQFHQVFQIAQDNQTSLQHDIFYEESSDTPSTNMLDSAVQDKEIIKQEMGRTVSISDCSDHNEDSDVQKAMENEGRRPHAKNLLAERRRRKKLNDRILALRSIVPKITKMNKAATLGDAIVYVEELQEEVKKLQDELDNTPDEVQQNFTTPKNQNDIKIQREYGESSDGLRMAIEGARLSRCTKIADQKTNEGCGRTVDEGQQQMEVQVEVTQVGVDEFSLKILCENKAGGFSRLMQAMDSLGLDVITVNIITFSGLALNRFQVEMTDNKVVQADQVRESLLELTRNPNG